MSDARELLAIGTFFIAAGFVLLNLPIISAIFCIIVGGIFFFSSLPFNY
jgi:hypothetical protein